MDESKNKKDGMQTNEENTDTLADTEAIQKEMEELAAVFQEELDKATKEAEEAEASLDRTESQIDTVDSEEKVEDAEESDEVTLCACCEEKPAGTAQNPDSPYCADCEKGLRHYPFDLLNVILVLAALALVFYGGFVFANHFEAYAVVAKADNLQAEHALYSAIDTYTVAANTMVNNHINGELVYKRELLAVHKLGMMNLLPETAGKIRPFEMQLPHFKALREVLDESESYMATSAAASQLVLPYESKKPEEIPYDECMAKLEALAKQKPEPLDREKAENTYVPAAPSYQPAMLSFYKYYLALLAEKPIETQLLYAEEIKEAAPDALWLYGALLGDLYAKSGKDVESICLLLEQENKEDDTPSLLRVEAKRIAGKTQEAIDSAEEKIKAESSMTVEFLRQQALCYLALEDFETAHQKAQAAFDLAFSSDAPSIQICDTYALTSIAAGKDDAFQTVSKIFKENDMAISKEVMEYKEGKRTLTSIIAEGDYDL